MTRGIKIWTNIDIEAATREKGIRFNFRNKKERKENNEKRKTNKIVSSTCCNVHVITKSKGSGLTHKELDDVG